MKHLGNTPPFLGPKGEVLPGSIAEIRYLPLGGLDQWVMTRGESLANPPLILLHGGPGMGRGAAGRRRVCTYQKFPITRSRPRSEGGVNR
jgi:pimeloyl-ACP methyl ester carboxylesterase